MAEAATESAFLEHCTSRSLFSRSEIGIRIALGVAGVLIAVIWLVMLFSCDQNRRMKPFAPLLTALILIVLLGSSVAAPAPAKGRMLTDLNVIPTRVLQRSISPKFYKSLLISPVEGWVIVRAQLSGTRLAGARVIRSELKGLFDPLALQLAKEAVIAKGDSIDRPNVKSSVLLHVLVYEIADATMVLSFVHLDGAGGDQMDYAGCARLLILKGGKWTEIKGPESLADKGWAVRQSLKNNYEANLRLDMRAGAEGTNMGQ